MSKTPTTFELQSALTVARLTPADGGTRDSLRAAFGSHATGGLFRSKDLDRGRELLETSGLLSSDGNWITPTATLLSLRDHASDVATELILQVVLTANPPLWLFAALDGEEVRWENVPDDDASALAASIGEAERREALLLSLGRTVDENSRRLLGSEGEDQVVRECRDYLLAKGREDLAHEVRRVSDISDQLGYDVTSPDTSGKRHRLEVKTSASGPDNPDRVHFYISRNEAKVGSADPQWALVAAIKDVVSGDVRILGWCRAADFAGALPEDPTDWGRWSSARISIPTTAFTEGLPLDR